MGDPELYQNLLGVEYPWRVESVRMNVEKQRVDVTVGHPSKILFPVRYVAWRLRFLTLSKKGFGDTWTADRFLPTSMPGFPGSPTRPDFRKNQIFNGFFRLPED